MQKKDMSEISQIKQDCRNLRAMYNNQKNRALRFETKFKQQQQKNIELALRIQELEEQQQQNIQTIEEYQRIIFHKKSKRQEKNDAQKAHQSIFNEAKNTTRTKTSYTRPVPHTSEITDSLECPIKECPECGDTLCDIQKYNKYTEDIDGSFVAQKSTKSIFEQIIHSGYCKQCKKRRSNKKIPKSPVVLGENVRMYINFQYTILRLSYTMIQNFLKIIHGIHVSQGEIANILREEAEMLRPEYERIRKVITSQKGVHFDETGWLVQQEQDGTYAWCMTGSETEEVLYELGINRGGGAVKLLAQNIQENAADRKKKEQEKKIIEFVGISDGYGGYTNKFESHQLCWAHPARKLRDLTESKSLSQEQRTRCLKTSDDFSKLYRRLRQEIEREKTREKNKCSRNAEEREQLKAKLIKKFFNITKTHKKDPPKLVTYKNTLAKYADKYFVCILIPGIPADNNKAERSLRHLVLKRKACHGSITKQSAESMSVNYSVMLSYFWKSPSQFFSKYKIARDNFQQITS